MARAAEVRALPHHARPRRTSERFASEAPWAPNRPHGAWCDARGEGAHLAQALRVQQARHGVHAQPLRFQQVQHVAPHQHGRQQLLRRRAQLAVRGEHPRHQRRQPLAVLALVDAGVRPPVVLRTRNPPHAHLGPIWQWAGYRTKTRGRGCGEAPRGMPPHHPLAAFRTGRSATRRPLCLPGAGESRSLRSLMLPASGECSAPSR